jgi:hypothetical protein
MEACQIAGRQNSPPDYTGHSIQCQKARLFGRINKGFARAILAITFFPHAGLVAMP